MPPSGPFCLLFAWAIPPDSEEGWGEGRMGKDDVTRRVFDKRTLRRMFKWVQIVCIFISNHTLTPTLLHGRHSFMAGISERMASTPASPRLPLRNQDRSTVQVYARLRPLFQPEADAGEYQAVDTTAGAPTVFQCQVCPCIHSPQHSPPPQKNNVHPIHSTPHHSTPHHSTHDITSHHLHSLAPPTPHPSKIRPSTHPFRWTTPHHTIPRGIMSHKLPLPP